PRTQTCGEGVGPVRTVLGCRDHWSFCGHWTTAHFFMGPSRRCNFDPLDMQAVRSQWEVVIRIAVFGATGATGRVVVDEAVRQRHAAWAFTRRRESWLLGRPGLLPVMGELADAEAVTRALAARDAVIVTLGHREDSPPDLMEKAVTRILEGMQLHR